jgi:hypothetical protein
MDTIDLIGSFISEGGKYGIGIIVVIAIIAILNIFGGGD